MFKWDKEESMWREINNEEVNMLKIGDKICITDLPEYDINGNDYNVISSGGTIRKIEYIVEMFDGPILRVDAGEYDKVSQKEEKENKMDNFDIEELKKDVLCGLDKRINDIFREYQDRLYIKSGDIYPEDEFDLDVIKEKIADKICKVLTYELSK